MKICVFGAGAVGSLFGAVLSARHQTTLIGRKAHVEAVRTNGLRIEGPKPWVARPAAEVSVDGLPTPDLVVLTVKSYDTQPALRQLRRLVAPTTILLTAQNGLGNWEEAREAFPTNVVLAATVATGVSLVEPGRLEWTGTWDVVVGGLPSNETDVARIVAALVEAGVPARPTSNIAGALWLKAIINAAYNPLSAIERLTNGALFSDPVQQARMRRITQEGVRVAQAEGVRLPEPGPWAFIERVAGTHGHHRSSMLQSVERGQRTENDQITGRILEVARRHGIQCPENERAWEAVRTLEASFPRPTPA